MNKSTFLFFLAFLSLQHTYAQQSSLSVEKIMQDPSWMGNFPTNLNWGEDGKTLYFDYNLANDPADSLYKVEIGNKDQIVKVSLQEQKERIPRYGDYNNSKTRKLVVEEGKLVLYDLRKKNRRELLEMGGRLSDAGFLADENKISFSFEDNAYLYDLEKGSLEKLTNIQSGQKRGRDKSDSASEKDKWIKKENLELLQVVRERKEKKEASDAYREMVQDPEDFTFYTGDKQLSNLTVSPDVNYVTFSLITRGSRDGTIVPNYVDASGHTVDLPARSKVGDDQTQVELAIYNLAKDTVYLAQTEKLPGISDLPDYVKDYPDKEWKEEPRDVILSGVYFSDNGKKAIVNVRSKDNKDRWIASLDLATGALTSLDRQRDEAWISGPGIGYSFGGGTLGWLPDNKHIYFQSEESGYSHLYLLNVET